MGDVKLSTVAGGITGNIKFFSGSIATVAPGASGAIITLTPPSGERIVLTCLATTGSAEGGVTVNVNGSPVITSKDLDSDTTTALDRFNVGAGSNGSVFSYPGTLKEIVGGIDEVITVVKDTGNTTRTIAYSYAETS